MLHKMFHKISHIFLIRKSIPFHFSFQNQVTLFFLYEFSDVLCPQTKNLHGFFSFKKNGKFWRVSLLGHFFKHKPFTSEACCFYSKLKPEGWHESFQWKIKASSNLKWLQKVLCVTNGTQNYLKKKQSVFQEIFGKSYNLTVKTKKNFFYFAYLMHWCLFKVDTWKYKSHFSIPINNWVSITIWTCWTI